MDGKVFFSNSEDETERVASLLAREVKYGSIISLKGNLGAGKTVFARGFAKGLGITEIVSSPTFTLVKEFKIDDLHWFYHMDVYRLEDSLSAISFGIEDYMLDKNSICLIEWAEKISDILPSDTIFVEIEYLEGDKRKISISYP